MKHARLLTLAFVLAGIVGCETTETAGRGNQEAKRLAALQRQQEHEQPDEARQNLWSAQENNLNRDGNPVRSSR